MTTSSQWVASRRTAVEMRPPRGPLNQAGVGVGPNEFFMGTPELLETKVRALKCFASQQQPDMDVFRQPAEVAHRQHLYHRVVEVPTGVKSGSVGAVRKRVCSTDTSLAAYSTSRTDLWEPGVEIPRAPRPLFSRR
ncbi:hypothetical protein ACH4Y0_15270 [Streptomyces sp. NPDC020707]|uniref:hypothetical protein n=1 Tax=Streptomyces sp. NPDC020707 TaxID=3365084 RepID=UPI0037B745FE